MKEIYKNILNGNLEKSLFLLEQINMFNSIVSLFYCILKMKSRTYKLYKQIVLTKTILDKYYISNENKRLILELAILNNSTYISKIFLRMGVVPRKNILSVSLSSNMSKLLMSFNIKGEHNAIIKK